jgi:hypothetical protein
MVYDPAQRVIDVDPDVEAAVRGAGREIGGEIIVRDVTWTGPGGVVKVIRKLPLPVQVRPQDLMFRMSLAIKRRELDARHVQIHSGDVKRRDRNCSQLQL